MELTVLAVPSFAGNAAKPAPTAPDPKAIKSVKALLQLARLQSDQKNAAGALASLRQARAIVAQTVKPGVVVTHWNGIPMETAVQINAEREAGSNLDARIIREEGGACEGGRQEGTGQERSRFEGDAGVVVAPLCERRPVFADDARSTVTDRRYNPVANVRT
jgi:hypothetical protein